MITADEIAQQLGGKPNGDGYRCKCPSHDGKSDNSLSVSQAPDGKVLIKCWGGCSTDEVLAVMGLRMRDLFPESNISPAQANQYRKKKQCADLEEAFHHELVVLEQYLAGRIAGRKYSRNPKFRAQRPEFCPPPDEPWDREILAVKRIRVALGEIYGR